MASTHSSLSYNTKFWNLLSIPLAFDHMSIINAHLGKKEPGKIPSFKSQMPHALGFSSKHNVSASIRETEF